MVTGPVPCPTCSCAHKMQLAEDMHMFSILLMGIHSLVALNNAEGFDLMFFIFIRALLPVTPAEQQHQVVASNQITFQGISLVSFCLSSIITECFVIFC